MRGGSRAGRKKSRSATLCARPTDKTCRAQTRVLLESVTHPPRPRRCATTVICAWPTAKDVDARANVIASGARVDAGAR